MTSLRTGVGLALIFGAVTQVSASGVSQPVPRGSIAPAAAPVRPQPVRAPVAPQYIRQRVSQLGQGFDGQIGIAVKSIDDGWEVGWRANELYPQQSVSKLWVSLTALDAVDRGRVRLDDRITLTRSDLTVFHQPIRDLILGRGSYTTTLGDLMFKAITTSDNTANDKVMRTVGGPEAVRRMIAAKRLGAIRFANGERSMQSRIAGLAWDQSYSIGGAFFAARNALPMSIRRAAFNRYIADPYDGAAPHAIVNALARLKRGELLSPASTGRLLDIMSNTHTGPNRLKGGLLPGWTLNHKTGTGQELGGVQTGYNDIGILTAPDGKSYAVAVMIKRTSTPLPVRMTLMSNLTRVVIAQHDQDNGGGGTGQRR